MWAFTPFAALCSLLPVIHAIPDDSPGAGYAEVSLVFPRNTTYPPTTHFPVVFAFQNVALARAHGLVASISYEIWNQSYIWNETKCQSWNGTDPESCGDQIPAWSWDPHYWNLSESSITEQQGKDRPYFHHKFHVDRFNKSGPDSSYRYRLKWNASWLYCNGSTFGRDEMKEGWIHARAAEWDWNGMVEFTIGGGDGNMELQNEVDLVAATATAGKENHCNPAEHGAVIPLYGKTLSVPEYARGASDRYDEDRFIYDVCPVLPDGITNGTTPPPGVPGMSPPSFNPCQVSVDKATAENWTAEIKGWMCDEIFYEDRRPADCPDKNSAGRPVAGVGMMCLASVLAVVGGFVLHVSSTGLC
ncbi:hypothetical protein V8F33_006839 [Rhypophila sp. PSN 637]